MRRKDGITKKVKFKQNYDCKEDIYGRTPVAYISGNDATPQNIHDAIFKNGLCGCGYKFAMVLDESKDEYELLEKETELYFLDDFLEEVCEYAGVERVKEWLKRKE